MHKASLSAAFAILVAEISVNTGAALGKGLFPLVGPEGVASLRTSIAAVILLVLIRPWHVTASRSQWGWLVLYGLSLGSMNLLIYWSIARIPMGLAVTIEICGPLAVVLLTSRTRQDFLWLAMAVCGIILLTPWPGSDASLDPLGVLFAVSAAVFWAIYILCGKQASRIGGRTAVALGMATACVVTVPFGVSHAGEKLLQPDVLMLGAVVALASSAIPYFLEMLALERLSSRVFGVVTSSAPAIAALVGVIMLGEHLALHQWAAIALIMSASAGCSLTSRPEKVAEPERISTELSA
ncbi:threonine transporter RhtB [Terrihabitans soli]|uniref:Threonine transporter RhtB n=1 Tax=Terrihabitans soli TaxID=708113 RepID=A0A6S6QLW8_9HYPH|nr:DMT family transporter [Terrihabitans soli]BCJ90336.1 threonine transporter RhtB [Terrihabitans soli]